MCTIHVYIFVIEGIAVLTICLLVLVISYVTLICAVIKGLAIAESDY